jgi:hypothetical protein
MAWSYYFALLSLPAPPLDPRYLSSSWQLSCVALGILLFSLDVGFDSPLRHGLAYHMGI